MASRFRYPGRGAADPQDATADGHVLPVEINADLPVGVLRLALVAALHQPCALQVVFARRVAVDDSEVSMRSVCC